MSQSFDWDDLYSDAQDELAEELGREPTDGEIEKRAQDKYEHMAAAAYDRAKDAWKYGDM